MPIYTDQVHAELSTLPPAAAVIKEFAEVARAKSEPRYFLTRLIWTAKSGMGRSSSRLLISEAG